MLPSINLLPWREAQRDKRKKRLLDLLLLSVLLVITMQWGVVYFLQQQAQTQQARLQYLNSYLAELDRQILEHKRLEQQHQYVLRRLSVVESLQTQRNKVTRFMDLLPSLIPQGVYVDEIKMNGAQVRLSGISGTTSRLATMLDNFESSTLIRDTDMRSIIQGEERFGEKFQIFNVSFSFDVEREQMVTKQGADNG